jgi:hypothetical protein
MHCVCSRVSLGTPPSPLLPGRPRCAALPSRAAPTWLPTIAGDAASSPRHGLPCGDVLHALLPSFSTAGPAARAILAGSPECPQRPHTASPARYLAVRGRFFQSNPTVLHPAADRLDAASPNLGLVRTSIGDWLSLPSDTLGAVGPLVATRRGQRTSETA